VTIRGLLRWIFGIPVLLLLILFALSNTEPVSLRLFPTDFSLEVPLSLAILAAMGIGFLLGGLRVWFTALHHRRAARRADDAVRLLEAKHRELSSRSADHVTRVG
jgi:lipopolysaccharide assembly protein A